MFDFLFGGIASAEVGKKPGEFQKFASDLKRHFENLGWNDLDTEKLDWEYYRKSRGNKPLIFTIFGEQSEQTVLFLRGVHGDESPQKRTNGGGVDINRNFPTKDWKQGKRDRYYSGPMQNSESETRFQIALINRFKPTHIISIHFPLGRHDYDGPSSNFDSIVIWLKKVSRENGLPFRRYQVFPGSLGNYAGMERRIHSRTLELPSSAPQKGAEYFDQFKSMFLGILDLNL